MVIKVPGRDILAVGEALKEVIKDNWDAGNTDGVTPQVYFVQDSKRFRLFGQDAVIVTNLEEFIEKQFIGGRYENAMYSGNIMVGTSRGYEASVLMKEELRRILRKRDIRFDPFRIAAPDLTGAVQIDIRRFTDRSFRQKRIGRWNCDFEIKHFGRAADPNEEAQS